MDRLTLLKSLAPGFLPLIIFIIADSIWGTRVGLMVAVVFGIIEFLISYVRERIVDKFILVDIGLIVFLGVVSISLDNDIFFKLKPAIIELIFCLILTVSLFSPANIIMMISRRYMKNIQFESHQKQAFNRSLKIMLVLFSIHTVLILYSAFFMSRQAWAFISGGLFYLLFLVYFVFEFTRNRIKKKRWLSQYGNDEWFDIVDREGRVVGRAPRGVCHSRPGYLHPVVHVHIMDNRDRIFLQKRSRKKEIQPGKWDTAIGGHIRSGEKIEEALKREAEEELGIKELAVQFVARYVWETEIESELVFMFLARYDREPAINRDEIEEGKFWKIKKIREKRGQNVFTPNFEHEFSLMEKQLFHST